MAQRERTQSSIEVVFGAVVRQKRKEMGLSQEQLALEADLNRTFVSDVERGLKSPTLATVEALAAALDTVPSILLQEVERQRTRR